MATESHGRAKYWWMVLLQGIAVIILSLLLLARPLETLFLLSLFLGVFLLIYAVIELYHALFSSRGVDSRLWMSIRGVLALIGSALILSSPLFSTAAIPNFILYSVALILIFIGAVSIFGKPQGEEKRHISTIILGILEILLGIAILIMPTQFGFVALVSVTGVLGMVMGITMIFDAFRLRKLI